MVNSRYAEPEWYTRENIKLINGTLLHICILHSFTLVIIEQINYKNPYFLTSCTRPRVAVAHFG
jgi:uncharacterized membrane protein